MPEADPREGLYLYAVVPADGGEAPDVAGLFERKVSLLPAGKVAAVVSPVPPDTGKIRPERRNLAAHQGVLWGLTGREAGLLPVAFGTVCPSPADLQDLLSDNEEDLLDQMERVGRALEMELRVELKVPDLFAYFISARPELREARDRVFGKGREPTRDEKIALGQLFQRVLDETREGLGREVKDALAGTAAELKENDCRSEKELVRYSLLVERSEQGALDRKIDELARRFGDEYTIVVTGPFPAYNFVDVHLRFDS